MSEEKPKDSSEATLSTDPEKAEESTEPDNQEETNSITADPFSGEHDGGLRAWLRVLGCFLLLANSMGIQSSFGGFQSYYEQNILNNYSSSDITWIGTVQIFCSSAGGIISGPLFDRGYDKYTVLLGCFFSVFAYMMTSLSTEYYQIFLAQGICGGLGGTFIFAPSVALVSLSFEKRRSLAVGLTTAGFIFGAVIYPIVFRRLLPMIGFPWTTRVIAFIAFGCFFFAYPLVYWKTPRPKTPVRKLLDLKAWKEPPYTLYCIAVFFMYAGYWPPYFFMVTLASRAIGASLDMAFYIFAISNASNFIARFTATLIADKFGPLEVMTVACFASTVIAFCWAAVGTIPGMIVWAIFWGYFSGIMSACFAAVVPALSPDPSIVGTRLGMLNFLWGVGALVSSPIAGEIIAAQGNRYTQVSGYLGMQMWVGSCLLVASFLFVYPLIHLRRQASAQKKAESE